jgi:predicted acyl esterase
LKATFTNVLEFPHLDVKWVKGLRIPMRDGIYLSADLCFPSDRLSAEKGWHNFPVVIEYTPYRKDEVVPGARFSEHLVRRGYIVARIDTRGTGASQGINTDEYPLQEQEDGYDAVEWIASQPWCDGHVAMTGMSYGGFTALQVAALQPPHLSAIIPINFTDDRYTDDCHYSGGLLRMYYDIVFYGNMMVAYNALPPFPEWAGDDWAAVWDTHLENNLPYMLEWLEHQVDGPYWRNGSVRDIAEQIQCPVFLIGGWRDGYPNPPLRLFQALRAPRKVLIGPWDHSWPDKAVPGPRIDFVHEVARWLDYWCKGLDTGIHKEPPVQVFVQEFQTPDVERLETVGEWRAETAYPAPGVMQKKFFLGEQNSLEGNRPADGKTALRYHPQVGVGKGLWSGGIKFGLPGDQRPDDAYSLLYTSQPLEDDLTILGNAHIRLYVSCDVPVLGFVASLCDVAEDGCSALIAKGVINATRNQSLTDPVPLEPGKVYPLDFDVDCTAWKFKRGHSIRLSIANADFPNLWPTPYPAVSQIHFGGEFCSSLELPVVPARGSADPVALPPSSAAVAAHSSAIHPPVWRVQRDILSGHSSVELGYASQSRIDENYVIEHSGKGVFDVDEKNPANASAHGHYSAAINRLGQVILAQSDIALVSGREYFFLTIDLEVRQNGLLHFQRHWTRTYPRRLL